MRGLCSFVSARAGEREREGDKSWKADVRNGGVWRAVVGGEGDLLCCDAPLHVLGRPVALAQDPGSPFGGRAELGQRFVIEKRRPRCLRIIALQAPNALHGGGGLRHVCGGGARWMTDAAFRSSSGGGARRAVGRCGVRGRRRPRGEWLAGDRAAAEGSSEHIT